MYEYIYIYILVQGDGPMALPSPASGAAVMLASRVWGLGFGV